MKLNLKKVGKITRISSLRDFVLFLFIYFTTNFAYAQETGAVPDTQAAADSGPSLKNISKNLTTSAEELETHRQEMLEYVYMILGFAAVFAFAWFLADKAKKRKEKEDEAKHQRVQHMLKHKTNQHRR